MHKIDDLAWSVQYQAKQIAKLEIQLEAHRKQIAYLEKREGKLTEYMKHVFRWLNKDYH